MEHKTIYTRRQFLASSGAAGMLLPLAATEARAAPGALPAEPSSDPGNGGLKGVFLNPPLSTRPMTRWWWFGGAMTPEEITRELTLMRNAGMGGVELQPVYPVAVDDPSRGIRNVRYFTTEWFDLVRHMLRETQRLGLQFDFTLGSGWPYGGPFIPDGLAAHKIEVLARNAAGPGEFSWPLYPLLTGGGRVFAAVAAPVLNTGELDASRSMVITEQIRRRGGGLHWQVPAGQWSIMLFMQSLTGQQVKRPTIGMEGWVIDHFRREALELFLDSVGNRTADELRPVAYPPFTSVFCDSLEVFGADWTPDFLKEFQKRRGYDLTPYLPALWQDSGALTPQIRYDYHQTLSDLMMDNFFGPLGEWARSRKMTARVQAHGAMGDVMRGYSLADIPEGEEGEFADRYSAIIDHRRLASSAGHIYQKPVISCESYTWLRSPLYLVTLEMMKGATDSSFLDGINQIVNQGYSSSPPQVGKPGWVFYASTMVNHNNIWWPHYKYLTRYIQRTAAVLQKGVSINPVAVYVPLADIYSRYGIGSLTMDTEIQRHLGPELFMNLRRAGYDFDLINDDALARIAAVENGTLRAGTASYRVLVVPNVEWMPPESLSRMAEFVQNGGLLVFVGRLPENAPGLQDHQARAAALRNTLASIWKNGQSGISAVQNSGKGKTALVADFAAVLKLIQAHLPPDFKIVEAGNSGSQTRERAVENVGFLHRRDGETDLYFLSNISKEVQDLRAQFLVGRRIPERWNPESGTVETTVPFDYARLSTGDVTEVQIHLDPFDSCFIVFAAQGSPILTKTNCAGPLRIEKTGDKTRVSALAPRNGEYFVVDAKGKNHHIRVKDVPEEVSVSGPWRLTLGDQAPIALNRLQPWADLPEGKSFSGWGRCETSFEMSDLGDDTEWVIDLGTVHETAEVLLNGVDLGAAWKGLRRLSCGSALKPGANRLEVRVGNLWIQKVESLPKPDLKPVAETFGIRWGLYGETSPPPLPPAGLLGPVRLVPLKRVTVTI
ncbi:MAG TPA: glycosyl hydrolase [Terriglobia bacterium]|nr:glycosyl hydrolase [Terriglobia bacterium]